MGTRRFKEIENMLYNANMYCDNPEDILTSFELMDAQSGADSYEPDFDERLQIDLEVSDSEEVLMTDFQEYQNKNLEKYLNALQNTTTYAEAKAVKDEYIAECAEVAPDYPLSKDGANQFWTSYKLRTKEFFKDTDSEEHKKNFIHFYRKLLKKGLTRKEHATIGMDVYDLGQKIAPKYVFSYKGSQIFRAKYNELKEHFAALAAEADKAKIQKLINDVIANKDNIKKLEEIRTQVYQDKKLDRDSKLPVYAKIKEVLNIPKAA
jgi:hypothetical protein